MKELFYKDENNYYKFEEVPEDFFEQNKILADEIQRLNNIIDGLEEYCYIYIRMNFNMNNSKIQEQIVEDYTNILNKLNELRGDNK